MKILTFDIEIANKIADKNETTTDPHYNYCGGWKDYTNMGISFLGAHKSWDDQILFFDENNLIKFLDLVEEADLVAGYNIFGFDTALLKATLVRLGYPKKTGMSGKCYDILGDIRKSLGTGYPKGWTLDNVAKSTIGETKLGEGAKAPELWQDGKYAELINYLTHDVRIEAALFQHILKEGWVRNGAVGVDKLELTQIKKYQEVTA